MAHLNFSNWDEVKANFSTVRFDYSRLLRIATAPHFNEPAARQWVSGYFSSDHDQYKPSTIQIADHFYLTLQVSLAYVVVVFGTKYLLMRNRQPFNLFVVSRLILVGSLITQMFNEQFCSALIAMHE